MKHPLSISAGLMVCMAFLTALAIAEDAELAGGSVPGLGYIDVHLHFSNQWKRPGGKGGPEQGDPRGTGRKHPRGGRPSAAATRSGSDGAPPVFTAADYAECADNMIALMDTFGIEKAVVMPQPRLAGQHGYYDYRVIVPAIAKYPDRLFLKDYPDRLLVASDQFVGIPNKTAKPPSYLEFTYEPMKDLPPDVLKKVGRDNAARLYNL